MRDSIQLQGLFPSRRARLWLRNKLLLLTYFWVAGAVLKVLAGDSDVVINEIMYHPPESRANLQYIELFNRGGSTVDLSDWSFTKGVQFKFPKGTRLAAGGYLVVCRDKTAFTAFYEIGRASCRKECR